MANVDMDWMAQGPHALLNNIHHMPRHQEKLLSKFDHDKSSIDDLYLHLGMPYVCFDDFPCILFPYILEGIASVWYHSLPPNSIHSWREFKKLFLEKKIYDKSLSMLLKEIGNIKMGDEEKVKEFNQTFTRLLNKFPTHV